MIIRREAFGGIFCVLLFCAMALAYCTVTPLWSPPDEIRHYAYAEYLVQEKQLPYLVPGDEQGRISLSIHPPLYYLLGTLFIRDDGRSVYDVITLRNALEPVSFVHDSTQASFPYRGIARQAYLFRLFSIVCGALTVWFIFVLGIQLFPRQPIVAFLAAVFTAALPQFIHISASISCENLSTCLCTLYLVTIVPLLKKNPPSVSRILASGILLGAAMLTKSSACIYGPITLVLFSLQSLRQKTWRPFFRCCVIGIVAASVSGWWYVRNIVYYNDAVFSKATGVIKPMVLRTSSYGPGYIERAITTTYRSFFGWFGSLEYPIGNGTLLLYTLFVVFSATGLIFIVYTGTWRKQPWSWLLLMVSCFFGGLFFLAANIGFTMFMGRYFFVVIGPIALMFAAGIVNLMPRTLCSRIIGAAATMYILIGLVVFIQVVLPAYRYPPINAPLPQLNFNATSEPLTSDGPGGQQFVSKLDNLCGIIVLASIETPSDLRAGFVLSEQSRDGFVPVHTGDIQMVRCEFVQLVFTFPPIEHSAGKLFRFTLAPMEPGVRESMRLWYQMQPPNYEEGMILNNSLQDGTLYHSLLYCTDEAYAEQWRSAGSIRSVVRPFVDLKELQTYYELPKRIRHHSELHDKLRAIQNVTGGKIIW